MKEIERERESEREANGPKRASNDSSDKRRQFGEGEGQRASATGATVADRK
jgi:hypothetical protein